MARPKLQAPPLVKVDYRTNDPVVGQFVLSDALICGIRGPYGSGKSTACIMKLLNNFKQQKPGEDGIIRRRSIIVRNTYPELKTTTIKSWHDWIPSTVGKWVAQGPPTHTIAAKGVEYEVIFLALDQAEDVRKVLSLDCSDAWLNEAREVPKAVLDGLTGRVGRYPRTVREGGRADGEILFTCAAPQIVMDTNPPDSDHWWAKMADFLDPEIEDRNHILAIELKRLGLLREGQELKHFYSQPSGRSAKAENLANLIPGYYQRLMADKSQDWIKVYVDGEYGFVQEGKPVYPEYVDSTHCQEFDLMRSQPVHVGIDFGRTPAATFGQRTPMGAWREHSELVTEDMGAIEFGHLLKRTIRERYDGLLIETITGDPAGAARSQADDNTPFLALRAAGIEARPASTNDPIKRREVVAAYLNKMIDGKPGMLIHPRCQKLRKALAGGYHFRRVAVAGEDRYHDEPVKDMSSHVAESQQYQMLGAGEARTVLRANPEFHANRKQYADGLDYDPFEGR
jgi:hypothetical protein